MNRLLIKQQIFYKNLNILFSFLLNDLDLSKLKRHYKLLFKRDTLRKIFKYDSFFDLYNNMYKFDLLNHITSNLLRFQRGRPAAVRVGAEKALSVYRYSC